MKKFLIHCEGIGLKHNAETDSYSLALMLAKGLSSSLPGTSWRVFERTAQGERLIAEYKGDQRISVES